MVPENFQDTQIQTVLLALNQVFSFYFNIYLASFSNFILNIVLLDDILQEIFHINFIYLESCMGVIRK